MAHNYSQLSAQIVFAVKRRQALIEKEWRTSLYKYINGFCKNHKATLLAVGGIFDHIHILIGYKPDVSLSNFEGKLKVATTNWINHNYYPSHAFSWQDGAGYFSYSNSELPNVINYIKNQEQHHLTESFEEEYKRMITFDGKFDSGMMFDPLE